MSVPSRILVDVAPSDEAEAEQRWRGFADHVQREIAGWDELYAVEFGDEPASAWPEFSVAATCYSPRAFAMCLAKCVSIVLGLQHELQGVRQ